MTAAPGRCLKQHVFGDFGAKTFSPPSRACAIEPSPQHLANYSAPRLQKHIIRILWMPPVYAIDCFLCAVATCPRVGWMGPVLVLDGGA